MVIKAINRKTFEIIHQHQVKAVIGFPSSWKMNSVIVIGDREIKINPISCWKQQFTATHDGVTRSTIKAKWNGKSTIEVFDTDHDDSHVFTLKRNGFFSWSYQMTDNKGKTIFDLVRKWNWRKMNYDLEVTRSFLNREDLMLELLSYAAYVAQLHIRQAASMS